jgi:hypothetical protein
LAQLYNTLNSLRQYKNPYSGGGYSNPYLQQPQLSEYETKLLPHVTKASDKAERRKKMLQPIEFIFDLLSRGQYVTANMAKQITRNVRKGRPAFEGASKEAWEGLLGKEKGDWSTVIWGGEDKGGEKFEGWGQKAGEQLEKSWGGRRVKGAAALAANILLDPTTYIPGFGPASKSKAAARELTGDALKIAAKKIGQEVSERIAGTGVSKAVAEAEAVAARAAFASGKKIPEKINKIIGRDLNRELSNVVTKAKFEAKRLPAATLRKQMLEETSKFKPEVTNIIENIFEDVPQLRKVEAPVADLADMISRLKAGTAYEGAGTRAFKFMGKEVKSTVGERYPAIVKAWDSVAKKVRESKVGSLYNNAWWAVMTNPKSPVAALRKAFNIRTPYQQYLANIKQDITAIAPHLRDDYMKMVGNTFKDLKPEEEQLLRDAWFEVQRTNVDIGDLLRGRGLSEEQVTKLVKAKTQIQGLFDAGWKKLQEAYELDPTIFGGKKIGEGIAQYLPLARERTNLGMFPQSKTIAGPRVEGFMNPRETTHLAGVSQENKIWQTIFPGLDEAEIADIASKYELTRFQNMDLKEMIMGRLFAQARVEQNIKLITQFREFGVKLDDVVKGDPGIGSWLSGNFQDFGLQTVKDSRLEGYLFDPEVAGIFERVLMPTVNDETMKQFEKFFHSATGVWKGWATLSPGFHFRNFFSNTLTGWIKHGVDWLNPKKQFDAMVGTYYGLYGEEAFPIFKKLGMDEDRIAQVLATKYGESTLKDAADLARARGVLSKATMGVDVPTATEQLYKKGNLNPLSPQFKLFGVSREAGSIVESQPRFLSFLLDYEKGGGTEAAMDWASWEAKKWFIDYTDLSPFEQKIMKNVIPFYTWIRKNLANQMAGLMEFTEMYSMLPKMTKGGPEGEIPDWMRQVGYFPIQQIIGNKSDALRMMWPNLPYMDLNKIPLQFEMTESGFPIPRLGGKEVLGDIISSAHPLLKTVFEIAPPEVWDVYYRRNLKEGEANPEILNKLSKIAVANPSLMQFLDGFLVNIGVENGLSGNLDDKGRLTIDPKLGRILNNNFPMLQKISQYMDLPEFLAESIRSVRVKVKDEKDEANRAALGLRVLAFYVGAKFKDVDVDAELSREGDEILREAEKERSKERKKEPDYQRVKMNTIKSHMFRKRKMGLR